jgi:hypothetical protein
VVCFQEAGILREFGNPVKEYLGTTARPMMCNNSHGIRGDPARVIHRRVSTPCNLSNVVRSLQVSLRLG